MESLRNASPQIDIERDSNYREIERLLYLVSKVKCFDGDQLISSVAERIIAFDGKNVFDLKTWYETSGLKPLRLGIEDAFSVTMGENKYCHESDQMGQRQS